MCRRFRSALSPLRSGNTMRCTIVQVFPVPAWASTIPCRERSMRWSARSIISPPSRAGSVATKAQKRHLPRDREAREPGVPPTDRVAVAVPLAHPEWMHARGLWPGIPEGAEIGRIEDPWSLGPDPASNRDWLPLEDPLGTVAHHPCAPPIPDGSHLLLLRCAIRLPPDRVEPSGADPASCRETAPSPRVSRRARPHHLASPGLPVHPDGY